ncbi:hypothetical protein WJX73_002237 [Symbiochloris irregularis]|uniref:Uncharacterized protein n=1 Tax=Symbiochloris irregularis TaxID=706552 RepID=A0AAW1PIN8_9CHLO
MRNLARRVEEVTGWKCVCLGYPSRSQPLQALAEGLVEEIKAAAGSSGRVFAVTHSMGGIVLRHIMGLKDQGGVKWLGSILLCPPNQGSAVARIMSQVWGVGTIFGFIYGRAGMELGQE